MKNTSLFRRVLSMVLTIAMVFSLLVPSISAESPKAAATTEELALTPIDPGTMESQKLTNEPTDESATKADFAPTDVVRVSIVLDKASTLDAGFSTKGVANNAAAKAYREGLRADQAALTAMIEKTTGSTLDVKWNLTLAANIISANVQYGQIETIKGVEGVKDVFLENRYEPQADVEEDEPNNGSASYMIGANVTWAAGLTGAGSKIAIIDTGADTEHLSFSGEALEYAFAQTAAEKGISYDEYVASLNLLTPESIEALKSQLNAPIGSGAAAYRNAKIGFGYNYVDKNVTYIEHDQDTEGEHGSHVAGISTANRYVKIGGEFKPALDAVLTQGVAPDAQLVVMKVFGKGGGAYSSDYMVALEDAIVLGCDSANLSLGSSAPGFGFSDEYEDVLNKLVENDMAVAISAGNSYMWLDTPKVEGMYPYLYTDDVSYHTGGSPGSFTNSLCVASSINKGQTGLPLFFGDRHVFYNESATYGNQSIMTLAGADRQYVLVDGPGVDDNDHVGGEGDQFAALGSEVLTGKIAMCYRGSSSFFAKANAAMAQGAIGIIIINNQPGLIGMNLTGYNYTAPAVMITEDDGDGIKADSTPVKNDAGEVLYYTGTMSVGTEAEILLPTDFSDTVDISAFSSYGTPGTLVLKPEILAPGGSIYSVWGANTGESSPQSAHDQYELMSGTSMAAPQVAGMAGVMGQYIRENDLCAKTGLTERQLINSLLMSTAHPVYDADGNYWPVFRVGAGHANVADAVSAQSYILMDQNATLFPDSAKDGKVKVELGDDPNYNGVYDYSFTVYPMTDSKSFSLRTDIFTQGIAGNGGYGMLQNTATMLIGANTTYEINGETYEDYFTVEADVNKDGATTAADAQAILDKLTGELAEGAEFDETVADVDGDGKITTYDAKLILNSAASPTITITEPTKVNVHIALDEGDCAVLLRYFTKGFYVEGYTYVEPQADKEGAVDVVHSIPIFGFYGCYTDPAMLDRSSLIDNAYGTGVIPYMGNSNTNYMNVKTASGDTYTFMGNPYAVEDTFPADRLALNSESAIQSFNYLNIRNIATLGFAVTDEEGKVLYAQATPTQKYSAYYYVSGGTWQNTNPANYNVGKKLSAAGVQEGDKVTVGFYALPEYYGIVNAKLNGEIATAGGLDTAGLKNVLEAGVVGNGAGIIYTVTIDNTAPVVKRCYRDVITGDIAVSAADNQYIAYVALLNGAGTEQYVGVVPQQTEAGEEVLVPLELDGKTLPKTVTLIVADYAGNEAAYKIELGGSSAEQERMVIGFVRESTTAAPGEGNRAWAINPDTLQYDYQNNTYDGISVFSTVPAPVIAAEYVDGFVFMAAEDGWFYAADLNGLSEAAPMGKYTETVDGIRDMAFNENNKTMYVLGNNNVIYSMDLTNGALTPAVHVTLSDATGDATSKVNTMAIDGKGVFYLGGSGTTSYSKMYKFELPEEEAGDPSLDELGDLVYGYDFETDLGEEGWTLVDKDGDGNNWTVDSSSANQGTKAIVSNSYLNSTALTPDNWAISPAINLSGKTGATFTIYAKNHMGSFPDTIALYAGTSNNPDEMTQVKADFQPGADWSLYTADLSAFAGEQNVYVAVRHYNCTDQFKVYVDTVGVYAVGTAEPEPEEVLEVELTAVGNLGVYNLGKGGSMAWDHENNVLYMVSNYNDTQDYDHYLWTVNTKTGKATKVNSVASNYSARLYGAVTGLFIVPGHTPIVQPTDTAIDVIAVPSEVTLMKGMTAQLHANVMPWNISDNSVTFSSNKPEVATVSDKGVVNAVGIGDAVVTITSVAEPHLTTEVAVHVVEAPVAELRAIIWDEQAKGQASVFNTNKTNEWTAEGEVGRFRWGVLVGDIVYGSDDKTVMAFDADTYEVTNYGGIASSWIYSDAEVMPQDFVDAFAAMGHNVGPMIGPCNNGTFLNMLDPVAGKVLYFNLGDSLFGSDPMVGIAYIGRTTYTYQGNTDDNAAMYAIITESGDVYAVNLHHAGSIGWELLGSTGIDLSGAADATSGIMASLHYNEENNFLYLSYTDDEEYAYLYAIDFDDVTVNGCVGDFNKGVFPVVGLYEYTPGTDLSLKVEPTNVSIYEGETAEISIKVKLGETNEYTAVVTDPTICSFENGVVTGLKEGETTIVITTVDVNEAGEHLTETVNVKVSANGTQPVDPVNPGGEVTGNVLQGFYFESDPATEGWTFVDSDNDGHNWTWYNTSMPGKTMSVYEGEGIIYSESFVNGESETDPGTVLYPDNWAISPAINLTNAAEDAIVSVRAYGQDSSGYDKEHFTIYAGTTPNPANMVAISSEYVSNHTWKQYTGSLANFVGQSQVYIAIRHHNVSDQFILNIDAVEVMDTLSSNPGTPDPQPVDGDVLYSYSFETEAEFEAWTNVDADGDTYGWMLRTQGDGDNEWDILDGDHMIFSASYMGTPVTPDNWIVSPAMDLSEAEKPVLSIWAQAQDASYPNEKFALYAGNSTDINSMTLIGGPYILTATKAHGDWINYTAEIPASLLSSNVYVAIRHYDCTDMFYINVDMVQIIDAGEQPSVAKNVPAKTYDAVTLKASVSGPFDGFCSASADVSFDAPAEIAKFGEAANTSTGSTNAVKAELTSEPVKMPVDETTLTNGNVKIVLTEDKDVTNGLITVTYNADLLTFVGVVPEMAFKSVHHEIVAPAEGEEPALTTGVITIAYASVEKITAESVLATLNFTYTDKNLDTTVVVKTLERNNDVAVDEDALVISIKAENEECAISHFTDIDEYPHGTVEHRAIEWAYLNGVTGGTGDGTTFEPAKIVSRAEAMLFLYAAAGRPEFEMPDNKFTDVKKSHWAYNAIMWAVANGITGGTGDGTTFSPNKTCTRAEILQFFYAAEGKPAYTIENPYSDVKDKHWYKDGAIWAYENGLEKGEDGKFHANTDCTRLSTVLYLYRYFTKQGLIE